MSAYVALAADVYPSHLMICYECENQIVFIHAMCPHFGVCYFHLCTCTLVQADEDVVYEDVNSLRTVDSQNDMLVSSWVF